MKEPGLTWITIYWKRRVLAITFNIFCVTHSVVMSSFWKRPVVVLAFLRSFWWPIIKMHNYSTSHEVMIHGLQASNQNQPDCKEPVLTLCQLQKLKHNWHYCSIPYKNEREFCISYIMWNKTTVHSGLCKIPGVWFSSWKFNSAWIINHLWITYK